MTPSDTSLRWYSWDIVYGDPEARCRERSRLNPMLRRQKDGAPKEVSVTRKEVTIKSPCRRVFDKKDTTPFMSPYNCENSGWEMVPSCSQPSIYSIRGTSLSRLGLRSLLGVVRIRDHIPIQKYFDSHSRRNGRRGVR